MGDVYSRLDELSDLGPKDGWKELKEFQNEIFRSDYEHHLKTDILARISHQFEEWKKDREEYKKEKEVKREFWENSEKKTKDLEDSIKEIERDVFDIESKEEFSFLNHAFKEIEKDYKDTNLTRKHHKELSGKLKQLKDGIKTKKNELIEGERKTFYSSINPDFEIPSLIDYDTKTANTEEDIDISRVGTQYVLETNLDSLLELYSDLFKFKSAGSKKSELRPQQVQYLVTCFEAITNKQDVIIEGPTGLGKTRALIGAVLPYILNPEKKKKILYTTRTIAQVDNVAKEIKELREVSPIFSGIKATVFVGRERIREDKKCYEKIPDIDPSDFVDDDGELFDEDECNKTCKKFFMFKNDHESLDEKLGKGFSIDLDSLDDYPFCPVKIYQKASKKADIIIAPHTYLSDTYWIKKYLLDADTTLEDIVLIVDESHNYVADCANQPFLTLSKKTNEETDRISSRTNNQYCMHDLSWDIEKNFLNRELEGEEPIFYENINLRDFFYELRNIYSIIQEHVPRQTNLIKEDQMDEFINNLPVEFVDELKKSNNYIQSFLNDNQEEIYYAIKPNEETKFLRTISHHMHSYSQLISSFIEIIDNPRDFLIRKEEEKINFYNLTPEKSIERDLKNYSSRIFTSATITPVKDVATVTGLEDAIKVQIDPVFPEENYKPFIITGVNSSRKGIGEKAEYFSSGEKEILTDLFDEAFSSAKTKNIGVFCNSNNCVEEVYGIIKKINNYDI
ncbi:MAG: DEAD/DEAH box helicase, partial [Nanoarchaeota archaeon]|nr:DEAD/DEAH box helicase [Nanoarchaeota archaeon]MBU1598303.1 DEAD/DEAH box helicase [Nanoarchaeota archaeon]